MTWTPGRERRAIVQHLTRCRFCRALRNYGRRRRDALLQHAAEELAHEHVADERERVTLARGEGE